jgi:hypothetical protein
LTAALRAGRGSTGAVVKVLVALCPKGSLEPWRWRELCSVHSDPDEFRLAEKTEFMLPVAIRRGNGVTTLLAELHFVERARTETGVVFEHQGDPATLAEVDRIEDEIGSFPGWQR